MPTTEDLIMMLRVFTAFLLGGLVGWERERMRRPAGLRTHMLVAIGSALFVLVPQQAGVVVGDMSRVIQGIVTGVGFLGAGAIIKHASDQSVQGLTTAAGVWLTAAIGIACGMGREATAVLSTLLALAVLTVVPHLVGKGTDADGDHNARRDDNRNS